MNDPVVVLDTRVVTGRGGGPDKTILNSPRFLAPYGYRMLCAYMHPPDDPGFDTIRTRAAELNATLIPVADRGALDISVAHRLLNICRRENVQIWHGHDYKSNLIGLALRPFWPMRLVTTVHGWVQYTRRTPLYYALDRVSLRGYKSIICVSDDLYVTCRKLGVPEVRCTLLENGIDTQRFRRTKNPKDVRQTLGLATDRPCVGAVGRLSAEKGFDVLIRAAARLLARGQRFTLVIAGEGDARDSLQLLINELGCHDHIRLLGFVADTIDLFQALDLFVLSSLREGLPNVVLEAMAMEVPVIATRIAGLPKLIDDGRNGLLIPPDSVDSLAVALETMLSDEPGRRQYAAAGRVTIEQRFSFERRMRRLARLYDELLSSPLAITRTRDAVSP